jgi:excisionase family DNA binding protein
MHAAAEMLGVSQVSVQRWCLDGTLPSVKLGRRRLIPSEALDRIVSTTEALAVS